MLREVDQVQARLASRRVCVVFFNGFRDFVGESERVLQFGFEGPYHCSCNARNEVCERDSQTEKLKGRTKHTLGHKQRGNIKPRTLFSPKTLYKFSPRRYYFQFAICKIKVS